MKYILLHVYSQGEMMVWLVLAIGTSASQGESSRQEDTLSSPLLLGMGFVGEVRRVGEWVGAWLRPWELYLTSLVLPRKFTRDSFHFLQFCPNEVTKVKKLQPYQSMHCLCNTAPTLAGLSWQWGSHVCKHMHFMQQCLQAHLKSSGPPCLDLT